MPGEAGHQSRVGHFSEEGGQQEVPRELLLERYPDAKLKPSRFLSPPLFDLINTTVKECCC